MKVDTFGTDEGSQVDRSGTQMEELAGDQKRISLICAVYDVAPYLPDFISSIDCQDVADSLLEVIMVDDGSTDGSALILREWAERRPEVIRVITKENGGQASARNEGLKVCTGDWISFPDPDDYFSDTHYLSNVLRVVEQAPELAMVVLNRVVFNELKGKTEDSHPLRCHFSRGDIIANLDTDWQFFNGHCGATFFRGDLIREHELFFDPKLRPIFEDGLYCARYLLRSSSHKVAFLKSVVYVYRRRQSATSTMQSSVSDLRRYTVVMQRGYIAAIEDALALCGEVPRWLQSMLLYQISWFFSEADQNKFGLKNWHVVELAIFNSAMERIAMILDDEVIDRFWVRGLKPQWREFLKFALKHVAWHQDSFSISKYDGVKRELRISYRFSGRRPAEAVFVDGRLISASAAKTRVLSYFGECLLFEQILWVPIDGLLEVSLDGEYVPAVTREPSQPMFSISARGAVQRLRGAQKKRTGKRPRLHKRLWKRFVTRRLLPFLRKGRFRDAWVFMDRIDAAGDSAERLFTYMHDSNPDINMWFVVSSSSGDYRRLRRRFRNRVVNFGGFRYQLLMQSSKVLVSSHMDLPIVRPAAALRWGGVRWKFVFLGHGVTQQDISHWMNTKDFALVLASTSAEYEAFAGDCSPYLVTSKEVALTGLPRFDRLAECRDSTDMDSRRILLVAPTWRKWLNSFISTDNLSAGFFESSYAEEWLGLLADERLFAVAERHDLEIVFLPHPSIEAHVGALSLPSRVTLASYAVDDVQKIFARTRVFVTDYSSSAFDLAFLERPVVYFQFDRDQVFGGQHIGRPGYFDYFRDGFGPVLEERSAVPNAIDVLLTGGFDDSFRGRVDSAFPYRMNPRCCEAAADAILDLFVARDRRPAVFGESLFLSDLG